MLNGKNGRAVGVVKGRARIFWRFSINEFWKNIGCLVSYSTFGLGGSRLWEKYKSKEFIINKCKRSSTRVKIYLYEVCVYPIIFLSSFLFY